jgi:hypothetical protein
VLPQELREAEIVQVIDNRFRNVFDKPSLMRPAVAEFTVFGDSEKRVGSGFRIPEIFRRIPTDYLS